MLSTLVKESSKNLPLIIERNVPLADKNMFKTGGCAQFYCRPKTIEQCAQSIAYAHANNLALFVLGSGANILINDQGFQGLVIHPALDSIDIINTDALSSDVFVKAGSGLLLDQ